MTPRIAGFEIRGFKSIESMRLDARQLNVFIGANGAGKSNLIAFFRMLSWMVKSVDRFQEHIGSLGWASSVLFDGPQVTPEVSGWIELETQQGYNEYAFRLARSGKDELFFAEEKVLYSDRSIGVRNPNWKELGFGHANSRLAEMASSDSTIGVITTLLRKIYVYQFHNTSPESDIRHSWSAADGRYLKENAGNLGSFLLNMQQNHSDYYLRMVRYIQAVLPFFDSFELEESRGRVLLRWKERGSDQVFFAGQASDGMLRMVALIALLSQPPKGLPPVMFIDEPELGLHPAAITKLAGLLKKASEHCQIFISTQSVGLLNEFEAEDVIVVERGRAGGLMGDSMVEEQELGSTRSGRASHFRRLDAVKLQDWLAQYSLGELWEKNVLGGRP